MKWDKYVEFAGRNPKLRQLLDELVGPQQLNTKIFPLFKTWVEKQVDYVAVRPWTSLRLDSCDSRIVRHVVYYHIENNEDIGGRARFLKDPDNRRGSVSKTIESVVDWYGAYWALQNDRPLVFDAVVRINNNGDVNGYQREAFEFFVAPEGFMP
jgi:hypothetical protein